jgi:putative membrane protein
LQWELISTQEGGKKVNDVKITDNELSMKRTLMSSERTLLSWVRTALSFISFGFTMYKVLESIATKLSMSIEVLQPRHLGLFLMGVGTIPLAVGMYQYYLMAVNLGKTVKEAVLNPSFFLAFIVLLLGITLFLDIVFRWHLL